MTMKNYDLFVPIGRNCSPTYNLREFGLQNRSFPFDWIGVDISIATDLICSDFKDFLILNNLKKEQHEKLCVYFDDFLKIRFMHDFLGKKSFDEEYEFVKKNIIGVLKDFMRR